MYSMNILELFWNNSLITAQAYLIKHLFSNKELTDGQNIFIFILSPTIIGLQV